VVQMGSQTHKRGEVIFDQIHMKIIHKSREPSFVAERVCKAKFIEIGLHRASDAADQRHATTRRVPPAFLGPSITVVRVLSATSPMAWPCA